MLYVFFWGGEGLRLHQPGLLMSSISEEKEIQKVVFWICLFALNQRPRSSSGAAPSCWERTWQLVS